MNRAAVVIGSGFAGLSAASFMAQAGWKVTVLEKNDGPGGRARQMREGGFVFDTGPSWYWMPDVFERYFASFGKKVSDYYSLSRLDPSYRIFWENGYDDIPAGTQAVMELFERYEPGAGERLEDFLTEAAYKYRVGMKQLVYKPGLSLHEFIDRDLLLGLFRLDVFTSIKKHIAKNFKDPRIRQLLEFPVLFLGALPRDTPALYSLMNFADIEGGTWYPAGGMYSVAHAMYTLAKELGVDFRFNEEVTGFAFDGDNVSSVRTISDEYSADAVVAGADYQFVEQNLLPGRLRTYSPEYWESREMSPSCLLFFVGLNKKLRNVRHHNLFFDTSFSQHAEEIYRTKQWPRDPLFYMNVPSVTDPAVAPDGCENLFLLVPVASGIEGDTAELREKYFEMIIARVERHTGEPIGGNIIYQKSFGPSDFSKTFNAFRGNAYGLANTLSQTAYLKPKCRSSKVKNLYYAGQLTVPGPGVPPSLISGEVVARVVNANKKYTANEL